MNGRYYCMTIYIRLQLSYNTLICIVILLVIDVRSYIIDLLSFEQCLFTIQIQQCYMELEMIVRSVADL